MSMDRKTTIYELEAGKIPSFEKCVQAVHSNASHVSLAACEFELILSL